jgi:hypothetical protein
LKKFGEAFTAGFPPFMRGSAQGGRAAQQEKKNGDSSGEIYKKIIDIGNVCIMFITLLVLPPPGLRIV